MKIPLYCHIMMISCTIWWLANGPFRSFEMGRFGYLKRPIWLCPAHPLLNGAISGWAPLSHGFPGPFRRKGALVWVSGTLVAIIATLCWASCGPGKGCARTTGRPVHGCELVIIAPSVTRRNRKHWLFSIYRTMTSSWFLISLAYHMCVRFFKTEKEMLGRARCLSFSKLGSKTTIKLYGLKSKSTWAWWIENTLFFNEK